MRSPLRRLGTDTGYLLAGFPLSIVAFVLVVTGFSAGLGTAVVLIGLFIVSGTLLIARGFAEVERRMLTEVIGKPLAQPRYTPAPEGSGWLRRAVHPMTVGQSWLDLLHGILIFPIAIATFVITVTWWALTITGLTYPLYGWIIRDIPGNRQLPEFLGYGDSATVDNLFHTGLGVIAVITLPFVIRGAALVRAAFGRALLTGVAELHQRIDGLTEGRAAAVSAEANALRRLERDIHDGPQQRLVHLGMELARAQRQLDNDPQAARGTLGQAITQTREALDELRTLSRGIAPPILTDRGLGPAITALAGRASIPIELDVQVDERYPAAVENALYFVAAESLTNIAKHSRATVGTVSVKRTADTLTMTIGDNGDGGAHVAKGHGLAGLADRLRAVDGELVVHSPVGGPTVIGAEMPCGL